MTTARLRPVKALAHFTVDSARIMAKGSRTYYLWLALLVVLVTIGVLTYLEQLRTGLVMTSMRDPVLWGFYIGNFTFLVGVAAAAVILVIPAYVYDWGPIRRIVILGELLAISALAMCMLFVFVDLGRPDRLLHIMPLVGRMNIPSSLLAWDVLALNSYFYLNLGVVTYLLLNMYLGRKPNPRIYIPLVLLSIPLAVGIHSVTAFVYNGLPGRPFWNASILAPRFLVSAFCSGPAIMLITLQILRKTAGLPLTRAAVYKIAELMAYAMFVNLFFLGADVFKEVYSDTHHLQHLEYLYFGLDGKAPLVVYAWVSLICNIVAFVIFIVPRMRENLLTLNIGCVLILVGVFIEKGIGLVVPGYTPSVLGEIYDYSPTATEWLVSLGIFGVGGLIFTLTSRVAIAVTGGEFLSLGAGGGTGAESHEVLDKVDEDEKS